MSGAGSIGLKCVRICKQVRKVLLPSRGKRMKARSQLSAAEVTELREMLERRLSSIGLETQPEVALKIMDLSKRSDAQLHDYSKIIRSDPALSARLLKIANSAMFAQRKSVSNIDRACLLLGLERLRAMAMGFHLSKAAAVGDRTLSRVVWGQSVFRACLAAEAAKTVIPSHVSEAFVVGLMMDAGIPIMQRLLPGEYEAVIADKPNPGKLARAEFERLEFTHVDVIAATARRWKLPEVIAFPMEFHHTPPTESRNPAPHHRLHRIAYAVGNVDLSEREGVAPRTDAELLPGMSAMQRLLGVGPADLSRIVNKAGGEYSATNELFKDVADSMGAGDDLLERVRIGLLSAMDDLIVSGLKDESQAEPARIAIDGRAVELRIEDAGVAVACLYDTRGQKLIAHRFDPKRDTARTVCEALGLEMKSKDEVERLAGEMGRLAA